MLTGGLATGATRGVTSSILLRASFTIGEHYGCLRSSAILAAAWFRSSTSDTLQEAGQHEGTAGLRLPPVSPDNHKDRHGEANKVAHQAAVAA